MTPNLDNLKQQWQSLNHDTSSTSDTDADPKRIAHSSSSSNPKRIAKVYRQLFIIGVLWVFIAPLYGLSILPVWASILLTAYFVFTCILNRQVMLKARIVNFSTMTLIEAIEAVSELQKVRQRSKLYSYTAAAIVISLLLWHFYSVNLMMFIGGLVGLVIGLVIGLRIDYKVNLWIKEMNKTLEDALKE